MTKFLLKLLPLILKVISPEIRDELEQFLKMLKDKAKQTPNPWDDIIVELLETLLGL